MRTNDLNYSFSKNIELKAKKNPMTHEHPFFSIAENISKSDLTILSSLSQIIDKKEIEGHFYNA